MKNNSNLRAFSLIEISIVVLIIGLLIAGVTQSSRLINQAKINSAKALTQSSPVSSIDDLHLWIESTNPLESFGNENIEDGDTIDLSGSTNDWRDLNPQTSIRSHLTIGSAPTYKTDAINGLPAVLFDGSDDYLTSSNYTNISSGETTIFAVYRTPSTLAAGSIFSMSSSDGDVVNTQFAVTASTTTGYQLCVETDSICDSGTTDDVSTNTVYVISAVYTQDSDDPAEADTVTGLTFFQNGALQTDTHTATTGDVMSTNSSNSFELGRDNGTDENYFSGHLGELIIYSRDLKQEERQAVEEYLGKKWRVKMVTATI